VNDWLKEHTQVWKTPSRILSVADGEGRNSVWLASGGHAVDAFDISDVGVTKARQLAIKHQVSVNFAVADCDRFEWHQDHYDGVVAIFVQFADPALRERLFANMVRCLRPGGTLVLQGYTPKQLEYRTGGPSVTSHLNMPRSCCANRSNSSIFKSYTSMKRLWPKARATGAGPPWLEWLPDAAPSDHLLANTPNP